MLNLFRGKDHAAKRYPEALAGLLTLGKPADDTDYQPWADRLRDHMPDLIRMVLDDDLNKRGEKDPAVWASLHALEILGLLGAEAAAEPLMECFAWDDEWIREALPHVYAGIGSVAIPFLQAYLEDRSHDELDRAQVGEALVDMAQAHPTVRDEIVAYLTAFLDRPYADDSPAEERLTTFVIGNLGDLEARSAYPAIQRAFAENRVDTQITDLEFTEEQLGLRPKRDYSKLPEPPKEPGVRLSLVCKACGRERPYLFPKVYCDLGTVKKKNAKYSPIIIPQRVVCQKCGAVDQYEPSPMGYMQVTADALVQSVDKRQEFRREDQRVQYMEFTCRWGKMHPQEAVERYQMEIGKQPDDATLHVGYGNVLSFLGRNDEAEAEYERAAEVNPQEPQAWLNLAQLAEGRDDRATAMRHWRRVIEATSHSNLPPDDRQLLLDAAEASLEALRTGRKPEPVEGESFVITPTGEIYPGISGARTVAHPPAREARPVSPSFSQEARPVPRVGRNQKCPCGSGKKYKHCHGKSGK